MSEGNEYLRTRLRLLCQTMPTTARRRTARGRLKTCRELTEHLRRARQLRAYAASEADREAVERLIEDIERRRDELSDGGNLAARVRANRQSRGTPRSALQVEQLLRLLDFGGSSEA